MKQVRKRAFEASSKTFPCYKTVYSKPALYRKVKVKKLFCKYSTWGMYYKHS